MFPRNYVDGKISSQWVKTSIDHESFKLSIAVFAEELGSGLKPAKPIAKPKSTPATDLLTVYPMGDPHIGMYAWHEESGEDFDLAIAARDLRSAMQTLISASPKSQTGVVLNLGDFFHADNLENKTLRAGHVLDIDTRWPKVMRLGARLMVDCVGLALKQHEHVIVKNLIGNHDDHSSVALSLILDAYYRDDPRVTVDLSPNAFWYTEFGTTLIGATHGHNTKLTDLAEIMAADKSEEWGRTKFRYWYTGHVHHKSIIEKAGGVVIESFRTLAAKDAWTAHMATDQVGISVRLSSTISTERSPGTASISSMHGTSSMRLKYNGAWLGDRIPRSCRGTIS